MRFLQSPETFAVEEIPLYPLSGAGEHLYVTFRRSGLSTPHVLRELERKLGLKETEIGCAGNKDRDAVATQTISLPSRVRERAEKALGELGAEILSSTLHPHKLRTGKLAGNRFTVRLEMASPDEEGPLREALSRLESSGMPNAFGPQRFGDSDAAENGRLLFLGARPYGSFKKARFAISAFQALVFNELLSERRARGLCPGPIPGDLMKRHDSGGEFTAQESDDNLEWRVSALEVSPTGPILGRKMPWPSGQALELELEIAARFGLGQPSIQAAKAPGARRFLRVPTGPISVSAHETSATVCFLLPPGSYANVMLAEAGVEIVKPPSSKQPPGGS
jgi:tRNA pseudouridine13 synthase